MKHLKRQWLSLSKPDRGTACSNLVTAKEIRSNGLLSLKKVGIWKKISKFPPTCWYRTLAMAPTLHQGGRWTPAPLAYKSANIAVTTTTLGYCLQRSPVALVKTLDFGQPFKNPNKLHYYYIIHLTVTPKMWLNSPTSSVRRYLSQCASCSPCCSLSLHGSSVRLFLAVRVLYAADF